MNILGLCLSTGKGGLELYAYKAITALQAAGHTCHFAVAPTTFLRQREWSVTLLELQPGLRHLPWFTARKLARYIDAHQIDIVHMHWNKDLTLAALAKFLSKRKPKLVYSRHMEITRSKRDLYHRALYSQVDKMLVIANFVLEQANRYLPLHREQIVLLYLGVKASVRASAEDCARLLPDVVNNKNRFVVGMMGRIEYYKGQHVLFDALAILHQQNLQPFVVMAGAVMDQAYFNGLTRQIQAQGFANDVKYVGISQELDKLMSCCDVVVLTTYCETFGLVLVEAMRVGTAVIGTNAGGVPEIIKHNETGMLFEPGNARQLAGCLIALHDDKAQREKIAAAGKAYADAMFDEKQHFEKLEQVLAAL